MSRRRSDDSNSALSARTALNVDFLASIIDHVADPIFVKDSDLRFMLVNRAFCELVGQRRRDLLGKTDYDFFPKEEAEFFRNKDLDVFACGEEIAIEEEPVTDSHGIRHQLATTKVPLRNRRGEVTHLVGIIHDITKLKETESELRSTNEELERRVRERTAALEAAHQELLRKERLAVLGRLAGGLAHQIRNPLGSISNAAFVLRRMLRGHPNPDVASSVEIILEEASHTNRIITQLLDNARARAPIPNPVSVSELFEQALARHELPENVQVVRNMTDDLPAVTVDIDQMIAALANLIENAFDAMENEGTLSLSAQVQDADHVMLSVEDTGSGIAEEVQHALLEPLVTSKSRGLGLGLSTARTLIEAQGGTLEWTSTPGQGARFDLTLPVSNEDEPGD
jgi:PAS domain S-box-containing protein